MKYAGQYSNETYLSDILLPNLSVEYQMRYKYKLDGLELSYLDQLNPGPDS